MIVHADIIQGTPEWHELRKGKFTASHGTAIGNAGKGLDTYVKTKVLEIIGVEKERYSNATMERGHEMEPIARAKYEFENKVDVDEVGFIELDEHTGFSPDGLVGEEGMIEVKARDDAKHLMLLITKKPDSDVLWQIAMGLYVSGRKWCDFISYNPNFKQSLFTIRVMRDEDKITRIKAGLEKAVLIKKSLLEEPAVKAELE